jgi:hypothetical protein
MRLVGNFLPVVDPLCREKDFDLRLKFHLGLPFLAVCLDR